MLEIKGPNGTIYPVLAWDDKNVVLIDTGFHGQAGLIASEISKAGFSLKDITNVILTHHDLDHIGAAKELQGLGAQISAHEKEVPYLQGEKPFLKLEAMEKRMNSLTDGERAFYGLIKASAPKLVINVDKKLASNETLPFCGGIEVVHTPGHTHGHISLFFKEKGVLVAGDAANIINGVLSGANPYHTYDTAEAEKSFEKLKKYKAEYVVCYHGGMYCGQKV